VAVGRDDISSALRRLALAGRPVCLHSSLRSFGQVQDGADAVVDAFLAADCTLLVPSFSWTFAVGAPPDLRPARNGWDYEHPGRVGHSRNVYTPETSEIDRDMGAVPAAVVARPARARGDHPLSSFAALGAQAGEAVAAQKWGDPHAPLGWLTESEGSVLLAGVGLTALTLVHYAEQLAGRTLFRRWALDPNGRVEMVPVGGCSDGFDKLVPYLARVGQETRVGASRWLAYPASAALPVLVQTIRAEPELTRCARPSCGRCPDASAGGPLVD
jgi:aminoglycoside 3-N-acetyltransferase